VATILVVEDRPIDRKLLTTILETGGHIVLAAGDGAEALDRVRVSRPHLIISDILMPSIDGYEFVRRLRALPDVSATPVIFYTATYHELEARQLATQLGVVEILTKPSRSDRLLAAVSTMLASAPSTAPEVPDDTSFHAEHLQVVSNSLASKVREFEPTEQRMAVIVDLAQQISAERDSQALLRHVCGAARDVTLAQQAVLGILAESGETSRVISNGLPPEFGPLFEDPPLADPMVSSVVRDRVPLRVSLGDRPPKMGSADRAASPLRSVLIVPIGSPTRVLGWLALRNKIGPQGFTHDDERVAATLAAQAGIAYENALLYEDLNRRTMALEQEVQERRRAEQALRAAGERTRFALAVAQMATLEVDLSTEALVFADTLPSLMGRRNEDLQVTPAGLLRLVHHEDLPGLTEATLAAIRDRREYAVEFRVAWPDDSLHWYGARARFEYGGGGEPTRLVGVVMALDERKRLEEQVRLAQKMEALGQLAGGVAHDFNNLLTAILGYGNLLAEQFAEGDPRLADVEEVIKAGERAAGLTRQLLAFSRKQVLQRRVLDLNALVSDTSRLLTRVIGEDVLLEVLATPDALLLKADPGEVQQILMNLAVNARDAMPSGGRLSVETSCVTTDEVRQLSHGELRPGRYAILVVRDTGAGMSADTRRHLFEPFFTTKEHGKGTGLGLATVHTIVEQAGGSVSVRSEPGSGAEFSVYLPLTLEPLDEAPPMGKGRAKGGTETVLIVEDEDSVRVLTRVILERLGYAVLQANGAEEALHVTAQHDEIDLVLTDVIMAGASGPELFARLSATKPHLRVLYMSGYTGDVLAAHTPIGHEVTLLHKPFTADRLAEKVREVLER
jgi:signal transduction histidine kinase/DNA-binding response OmpR family regulator